MLGTTKLTNMLFLTQFFIMLIQVSFDRIKWANIVFYIETPIQYNNFLTYRFSDSLLGGISASWLHQQGEILHLEPNTHRGTVNTRISDLNLSRCARV